MATAAPVAGTADRRLGLFPGETVPGRRSGPGG